MLYEANGDPNNVKLMDYASATRFGGMGVMSNWPQLRSMKTIEGTHQYIAPEVYSGSYNFMCDYWSLGVLVYYMLTGEMPIEGDNEEDAQKNTLAWEFNIRDPAIKGVSVYAKEFLKKLLCKDPTKRA